MAGALALDLFPVRFAAANDSAQVAGHVLRLVLARHAFACDYADRLLPLDHNLPTVGAGSSEALAFVYNPANQILSRSGSNAVYDFANYQDGTTNKTYTGLNWDATMAAYS